MTIEAPGLAAQVGQRLAAIADGEVGPEAFDAARSRLLHAFGVSFASSTLPAAEIAWRASGSPAGAGGGCLVFGRPGGAAPDDAAFVNGMIGHSSLQEDAGPGGLREGSHPGTYVIPAALAAAESTGVSGQTFLRGVVAGYEAVGLIGEIAPPEIVKRRFRPLAVMGPFGAAAAAAVIYGATPDQIGSALDFAASMAGGTTEGIFEGTMEPYVQAGFAARSGLLAARLACAGARTSTQGLEGDFGFFRVYGGQTDSPRHLLPPGHLAVTRLGTKRFAACLQNQETVALIVAGLPDGLAERDVHRIVVRRPPLGTNGLNSPGVSREPPFENMLTAQMSARFTAAAAVLGHAVDDPAYFQSAYADREVTALAERVELRPVEDDSVSVRIERTTGEVVTLDVRAGDTMFPTSGEIRAGFVRRARPCLGDGVDRVLHLVDALEDIAHIGALTGALRVSPR